MKRINLTQHPARPEQGCQHRSDIQSGVIKHALTFTQLPTHQEIVARVNRLVAIARDCNADEAMLGGAPYLITLLDPALREVGIIPVYAFSLRESVEEVDRAGDTVKRTIFRHIGFVK